MKTIKDQNKPSVLSKAQVYRYPGSRPFRNGEQNQFYGREKEIVQLSNLIELERLVVVYARSGLGKTSLINAGIIPKLEEKKLSFSKLKNKELENSDRKKYAPVIPIRLNDSSLSPIATLHSSFKNLVDVNLLFDKENPCLWDYIKALNQTMANTPILIFDQFEELFNLYSEQQRKKFISELADVVNNNTPYSIKEKMDEWIADDDNDINNTLLSKIKSSETALRVKIVIAIRSDKIAYLDELSSKIPLILNNRFKLKALKKEQAKLAITAPAKLEGDFDSPTFNYDNKLLSNIVEFLSTEKMDEEEVETDKVESFQLQILCQYIESEVIKRRKAGLVDKAIANGVITIDSSYLENEQKMKDVLENFYENSISENVPPELQEKVRKLIEQGLILEGDYRDSKSKRSVTNEYQVPESVLTALVNCHLLRHERRLGQDFYEISHDTLVGPITKAHERRKKNKQSKHVNELEKEKDDLMKKDQRNSLLIKFLMAALVSALCILGYFQYQSILQKMDETEASLEAQIDKTELLSNENLKEYKTKNLIYQSSIFKNQNPSLSYRLAQEAIKVDPNNLLGQKNLYDLINRSASFPFYSIVSDKNTSVLGTQSDIAYSKSGRILLSSQRGQLFLIDKENKVKQLKSKFSKYIYDLKFFPNSNDKFILAADGGIYLMKLNGTSFSMTKKLPHKDTTVDAFDISEDSKTIASGDRNGVIQMWSAPFNQNTSSQKIHNGHVSEIMLSQNEKWLISTGWDKTVNLFSIDSLSSNNAKPLFSEKVEEKIICADLNKNRLVLGLEDGTILLWEIIKTIDPSNISFNIEGVKVPSFAQRPTIITREVLSSYGGHQGTINDIKFINDGKYILSASSDNTAKMWDHKGNLIKTFLGHHPSKVDAITFDGGQVTTVSSTIDDTPSKILQWDLNFTKWAQKYNSKVKRILETDDYIIASSPNIDSSMIQKGTLLYIYSNDESHSSNPIEVPLDVLAINQTSKKHMLIVAGNEQNGKILYEVNLKTRKVRRISDPHSSGTKSIYALEFINKNEVFTIGSDRKIIKWNLYDKEQKPLAFSKQTSKVGYSFDYDPNNKILLSGHYNGEAYLWDSNGNLLDTLDAHSGPIHVIKISSDGKVLLTAGNDRTIKLWSIKKQNDASFKIEQKYNFRGHSSKVTQLDFSSKGNTFLSASDDGTVKLWSYDLIKETYKELPSFIKHEQAINTALFTKKGDEIFTGSDDMTLKKWKKDEHYNSIKGVADLENEVQTIIQTEIDKEISKIEE